MPIALHEIYLKVIIEILSTYTCTVHKNIYLLFEFEFGYTRDYPFFSSRNSK